MIKTNRRWEEQISYLMLDKEDLFVSPGTWMSQKQATLSLVQSDRWSQLYARLSYPEGFRHFFRHGDKTYKYLKQNKHHVGPASLAESETQISSSDGRSQSMVGIVYCFFDGAL